MDINNRTISEILKHNLEIPENQRKYEWDNVNADDFYADLVDDIENNPESFYLGSILLLKKEPIKRVKTYQIIDGQQRITTIYIFLIALRQLAGKYGAEVAKNHIHSLIDVRNTFFKPSPSISKTFEHIKPITWDGTFPPLVDKRYKERIKPVFNHFFELIEKECKTFSDNQAEKYEDFFEELLKQVEDIQVAELIIDSDIEAFNLFERLNARGTMLSITDLLKNHIFAKGDKDLQDSWAKIDEDFSKNQLSIITMVRYFYMSQKGHIRKKNLYRELKSLANKNPKKFMNDLEVFSDYYVAISSLGHNSFTNCKNLLDEQFKINLQSDDRYFNIFKSLYGLKRYGISQTTPLIFSVLSSFKRLNLDEESRLRSTLTEFFENLERYHFISNFICKERANKVEEFYGNIAGSFYQVDSLSSFEDLIHEFYIEIPDIPGFDTFEENFIQLDYENNNKDIKEIFSRVNMANEDGVCLPRSSAQIFLLDPSKRRDHWNTEHWFPQKPKDNSITERLNNQNIIHNIGNLILIPTELNNKLNNLAPDEKAKKVKEDQKYSILANGHLQAFVEENESFHKIWADQHIIDRAKKLAAQCYNIYWKFAPKIRSKGGYSLN